MIELLDQLEAGGSRVDGQPAQRPVTRQQFDMGLVGSAPGKAGKLGDHRAGRAAAHFLEQGHGGHQRVSLSPEMSSGRARSARRGGKSLSAVVAAEKRTHYTPLLRYDGLLKTR